MIYSCKGHSEIGFRLTYICIVTPHARKSLTRSTLLMTSRPRSSKTKTFHIGSPSALRIGTEEEVGPLLAFGSAWPSVDCAGSWFKFKIFSIESAIEIISWMFAIHVWRPYGFDGPGGIDELMPWLQISLNKKDLSCVYGHSFCHLWKWIERVIVVQDRLSIPVSTN